MRLGEYSSWHLSDFVDWQARQQDAGATVARLHPGRLESSYNAVASKPHESKLMNAGKDLSHAGQHRTGRY